MSEREQKKTSKEIAIEVAREWGLEWELHYTAQQLIDRGYTEEEAYTEAFYTWDLG